MLNSLPRNGCVQGKQLFLGLCGGITISNQAHTRLELAHGIALALEFKLGGEVLRTVIVREWTELLILGAIIALRGALTLLIHWETHSEEKHLKEEEAHHAE